VNPATAFGRVLADELIRCGLREVVLAPGSRSTPLAMAFADADAGGHLRLHVRIDERSASYAALGLARASRRPVAVVCTSGTAAANFHPAVIEADESGVPLLVLTADRPPELRATGANQAIDQIKLYGSAVRWFAEAGVPEKRTGAVAYWRSLACQAWAMASAATGGFPGPVHLNIPFREPLVPDGEGDWPEPLDGRSDGGPWTRFGDRSRGGTGPDRDRGGTELTIGWTERGVIVCGDGDYETAWLLELAEQAGWPVLAEPSSNARRGQNAICSYQYLLGSPGFMAAHRPDVVISAGRPGLSRPQSALLALDNVTHIAVAQGPGRWADPSRRADVVADRIRLVDVPAGTRHDVPAGARHDVPAGTRRDVPAGTPDAIARNVSAETSPRGLRGAGEALPRGEGGDGQSPREQGGFGGDSSPRETWLRAWQRADALARRAVDAVLDESGEPSEPRLARDLARSIGEGSLLWAGNSLAVRDLDLQMPPRADVRVLGNRGTSGIDGSTSAAIGAALAHDGPAYAMIGDLALLHDAPGLALGPDEPRPDLCLIVVNNDGGGIFSGLEPASFPDSFERVFGTPHGASVRHVAEAFGIGYQRLDRADDLAKAIQGTGLRILEVRTGRAGGAALRARLGEASARALPDRP
jgi:2-succinyl-5-enolpyruvyl-6-hydroxy-3-cyclohexene-1-carboxylate synthase